MSKYRIYTTTYEDFNKLIQKSNYIAKYEDVVKLIDVTISMFGKIEMKEFSNIEEGLEYNLNKGINYKFIELRSKSGTAFYYVSEMNMVDGKIYITNHMCKIGNHWNLYFNAWNHVYAQGIGEVPHTRFSFSNDNRIYLYISVLLYTITHIDNISLEKEFNENKKII